MTERRTEFPAVMGAPYGTGEPFTEWCITSPDERGLTDSDLIDVTRPYMRGIVTMTVGQCSDLLVGAGAFDAIIWRVHKPGV